MEKIIFVIDSQNRNHKVTKMEFTSQNQSQLKTDVANTPMHVSKNSRENVHENVYF